MNNNYSIDCSYFFIVLLQALFITLKLTSVIDWPWVWILAPLWGSGLFVIAIILITVAIAYLVNKYGERPL